jgi:molybdopterin-guanine dinucleotide biosynthesis protein A
LADDIPVDAAILAGGRARRFGGRDKSSLTIGSASIFDRQLAAHGGVADRILVVTADPDRHRNRGLDLVTDLLPGTAPLGGLYTALAHATSERVLGVACDLPLLTASFLGHLVALPGAGDDVVVPRGPDGLQPLCAVYRRELAGPIRERLESIMARPRRLPPARAPDVRRLFVS